jgi:hypothetical protein
MEKNSKEMSCFGTDVISLVSEKCDDSVPETQF